MRRNLKLITASLLLTTAVLSAGCASNESLTDRLARGHVQGDADGAVVRAGSVAEAFPLAVGHCAHFGLSAQFDRKLSDETYRFRCAR